MPRFIACSILCRCSWQYNAALLLRRHSTAKPNSKPSRTFTIDMVSLKFLQHHKHYYSKKYQYLRNCKKQCFCRENLQIRALRKLWGIILRSPKASQLLPPRRELKDGFDWVEQFIVTAARSRAKPKLTRSSRALFDASVTRATWICVVNKQVVLEAGLGGYFGKTTIRGRGSASRFPSELVI